MAFKQTGVHGCALCIIQSDLFTVSFDMDLIDFSSKCGRIILFRRPHVLHMPVNFSNVVIFILAHKYHCLPGSHTLMTMPSFVPCQVILYKC